MCNWLILWQNALYLCLGRSRMCLILQETCCSNLVLKPWRLDQETSEEKLFTKVRQIAWHLRTDSSIVAQQIAIYRDLMRLDRYYLSRLREFCKYNFWPMLMFLCRVSFLTTLDIYKAYFRGRHIREYKENICKRWPMPYSL